MDRWREDESGETVEFTLKIQYTFRRDFREIVREKRK